MTNNIFMDLIYDKCKLTPKTFIKYLKHKTKVKKFRKTILNCSPSFNVLWNIADFIKLAEEIFMYDNNIDNKDLYLFSSRNYNNGENGFIFNGTEVSIAIKLFSATNTVLLEIKRKTGSKIKTLLSFENNQWGQNPSFKEEIILESVIEKITSNIIELFDRCYYRYLHT